MNKENPFIIVENATPLLLNSIKNLYICPSFACNQRCSHCTLRNLKIPMNMDKVIDSLIRILEVNKDVKLELFGGEPMLLSIEDLNKLYPYISQRHLTINTNLLDIDEPHFEFLKLANSIDTSFDLNRFENPYEVHKFLCNIDKLKENNMKFNIMTVLDKNTITTLKPENLVEMLGSLGPKFLELKIFIGKDGPDFENVQDYLCKLFDAWNISTGNLMFIEIARIILWGRKWKDYCYGYNYSMFPDGRIRMGCPYAEEFYEKPECKFCEYFNVCGGGCRLQKECRFPKKLYDKMCKLDKIELLNLASIGQNFDEK